MLRPLRAARLPNDPRNRCVGCGPANPVGLRLTFHRTGDVVSTRWVASPRFQGWPGRLHSGILYLAMLETANWTIFALRDRLGLPIRTGALQTQRWVATGEKLSLSGRQAPTRKAPHRVRVEAHDEDDRLVAALDREYALLDRQSFLKRMGYDSLPPVLEDLLPE